MPTGRAPRYRQARADCPECGRDVAAYVPRHGDGSAYRIVWHHGRTDDGGSSGPCPGRFEIVDTSDLTDEGFDGRR